MGEYGGAIRTAASLGECGKLSRTRRVAAPAGSLGARSAPEPRLTTWIRSSAPEVPPILPNPNGTRRDRETPRSPERLSTTAFARRYDKSRLYSSEPTALVCTLIMMRDDASLGSARAWLNSP